MAQIPESHQDIFKKKAFAHVATVGESGVPQVTPVWIDYDGEYVLMNTARGRVKDRKLKANPTVALSVQDPDNPYRYVGLQGTAVEDVEEGAVEHIHELSHRYRGQQYGSFQEGEVRVIYKIKPEKVWTMG